MSNARNLSKLLNSSGTVDAAKLTDTYMTGISNGSVTAAMLDTTYMTGIADGSITASKLVDTYLTGIAAGSITNTELAAGAATANIGYTPANKAGDTFSGNVNVTGAIVTTGDITGFGTF